MQEPSKDIPEEIRSGYMRGEPLTEEQQKAVVEATKTVQESDKKRENASQESRMKALKDSVLTMQRLSYGKLLEKLGLGMKKPTKYLANHVYTALVIHAEITMHLTYQTILQYFGPENAQHGIQALSHIFQKMGFMLVPIHRPKPIIKEEAKNAGEQTIPSANVDGVPNGQNVSNGETSTTPTENVQGSGTSPEQQEKHPVVDINK